MLLPSITVPAAGLSGPPHSALPTIHGDGQFGIPNPIGDLGSYVIGHVVDAVSAVLQAVANDFLDQLGTPVAEYVLHTPDLGDEPTLIRYWTVSLAVLGACLGLLLAVVGTTVIAGPDTRIGRAAREALGVRLAGGVAAAAVSLPVVALEVALANRIVDVFIGTGFASGHNPLWSALDQTSHGDAPAGLAVLVTITVGVALLVALLVLSLARWATLWLLIVLAPLVMGLSILPGGEGTARAWWRLQLTTVLLPVANAILLGTYAAMFTSDRTGLLGALAGVAVLALLTKLPGWAAGAALHVTAADVTGRVRQARHTLASTTSAATDRAGAGGTPLVPRRVPSSPTGPGRPTT